MSESRARPVAVPAAAQRHRRAGMDARALRAMLPAIGLMALLAYLALTPLPPFAADVYGSLARRYAITGAVLLGYLVWLIVRRRLPGRTPFDLPLAAVLVAVLLAVWRSLDARVSLEAVLPLLPALVLFYAVHDARSLDATRLALAVVAAAAVVALFALSSVWHATADWWELARAVDGGLSREMMLPPRSPRVADTGSHPNILGAVFAMALPPTLLLWTGYDDRRVRVAVAAAALVIVAALFFTLSRAAWVGALAGVVVCGAGLIAGERVAPRLPRAGWAVLAALVVLVALLLLWLLVSGARPDWLFRESLGPRADMRRAGWEMFRDNPLTGAGPGLFVALYPLYSGGYPFAAVHAHNILVQTAVDTGLLGLAAGAWLLIAVGVAVVLGLRAADPGRRRSVAAGAGMLAALLVHALADSPQLFPEVLLLGAVALTLIARGADGVRLLDAIPALAKFGTIDVAGVAASRAATVLVLALAAALPVAWLVTSRAHAASIDSLGDAREGRWPEAVEGAQRAVERDGSLAVYWYQLAAAHASAAIAGDRRAEQERALGSLQRGLELEPHNGAALVNYAALHVALGRPERARETLPALARLVGRDSLLLLAHATLTQWTAPPEQAVETYAGLLVINPSLAGTPFWQADPWRRASFDRIVDRALARVPEVAGDGPAADSLRTAIELYAGRGAPSIEALERALAARPDDVGLRVAAARLLMADEQGRAQAYDLLRGAVRLKGDDPAARAALGDWYALAGDTTRARREWARAAYLDDVGATVSLGNSYAPGAVPEPVAERGERLLQAAEIGRFYLIFQTLRFTFQRAEPIPIILPGDWLLALPAELPRWREQVEGWR